MLLAFLANTVRLAGVKRFCLDRPATGVRIGAVFAFLPQYFAHK